MRVAIYQTEGVPGDPTANVRAAADAIAEAAGRGANLLIFPEMYLTGYDIGRDLPRVAERVGGPSHRALADLARGHRIALLYGHGERADVGVYNAAALVDADGVLRFNYRKTHLYGDAERAMFLPGDRLPPPVLVGGLRVGVLICYDLEFPEAVRGLVLQGADLIAVPTALMRPNPVIPRLIVPTRAYENQVFVAYANRCGREATLAYEGQSAIIAPDGRALAQAGAEPALLVADIDPAAYAASRKANPYLADRRPALYRASS